MIIEMGNHCPTAPHAIDDRPRVTRILIPEADSTGRGGYTHQPGLSVADFTDHVKDAVLNRGRRWRLPEHEILIAVTQEAWTAHSGAQALSKTFVDGTPPQQGEYDFRPAWVHVTDDELTPAGRSQDLENWLREYYRVPDDAAKPLDDELEARYWTAGGEPGRGFPKPPPDLQANFTNDGRTQQAQNYAGGQLGVSGFLTAAGSGSATDASKSWTTNQWAGYRVYAVPGPAGGQQILFANVLSNSATVLTIDRWYNAASPGGAAATTPTVGATPVCAYILADGGNVSAWFVGLQYQAGYTPANTDHALPNEYQVGTPSGVTSSGGYLRKIAPYTLSQGTSPVTFTLTPVYTGTSGDVYPQTFYAIGVFNSMLVSAQTLNMKFGTTLNATASVAASGDQVSVTETITGS